MVSLWFYFFYFLFFLTKFIKFSVINELEGLSKGLKPTQALSTSENTFTALGVVPISATLVSQACARQHDSRHAQMVADASKEALAYLKTKPTAVK